MKTSMNYSEKQGGFGAFLGMLGLCFVIWWSPMVALIFKNIFSLQGFAIFWMALVVIFMFQVGVNSSENFARSMFKNAFELFEEFVSFGKFSLSSTMTFFFGVLPMIIIVAGSMFIYWTLFWIQILSDPVTYFLLIPMIHWLAPFFLGVVARNSRFFFVGWFKFVSPS
jgi:hypothetical protein